METKESIEATCPDCRGPLSVHRSGNSPVEIKCLVGHTYSVLGVLRAHGATQEDALWSAMVALKETGPLLEAVSGELSEEALLRLRAQVQKKERQAEILREIIEDLDPFDGSEKDLDQEG